MNFDVRFYFSLLLRRLPYILIILTVSVTIGVTLAYSLPPVFRAEARLLVESPQIPDELAASTVRSTGDEILLAIQQRLLTRANLLDLARQFGLYAETPEMTADGIIGEMRQRIGFNLPSSSGGSGVVTISFGSPDPGQSAAVTNALVSQMLEQNVALRTGASGDTLDFFQQEVKRLSEEMALQNARILEFKQQHREALPESLEYRRTRQSAQQERLLQVDRELAGLRDRRQRLTDLYDRTGRLAASIEALTPEETQLEQLRQQLASALVVYSPQNPRVRALQTQVAALEGAVKEQRGTAAADGVLTTFDLQMADIDGQIGFLAEQKGLLERELAALEVSIAATPGNAIALGALESDHENLRVQHNQAVASLAEARMGDRIEVTARGQRITVIEPAVAPTYRSEPNRKLIAAASLGLGGLLSAALLVLLELLNRSVRRPVELVSALGITPFGTVPYMATRSEIVRRRLSLAGTLAAIAVGVPAALYLVHVYLMPVDVLLATVAEKAGLGALVERFLPDTLG